MFPAFKEWHVIVEALGAGEQVLILRKGGIAEDRGGFKVKHSRFWLFPTLFHEQLAKTKPDAARFWAEAPSAKPASPEVVLKFWAEIVRSNFIADWDHVAALNAHHLWTEPVVRERFDWGRVPGLFALVARVHRMVEPITVTPTPEMAGCKSWIELPFDFETIPSIPVLSDAVFAAKQSALELGAP
ncbi:MAG TPA: DUF1802 family protein [Opitutaceae bacterium]|nr:DUF1802 family protein [Opitutaceae bacterium]